MRPNLQIYFDTAIVSGGALVVRDARIGAVVGSARFTGHDPARADSRRTPVPGDK
jgi:hypothetical protein